MGAKVLYAAQWLLLRKSSLPFLPIDTEGRAQRRLLTREAVSHTKTVFHQFGTGSQLSGGNVAPPALLCTDNIDNLPLIVSSVLVKLPGTHC